MGEKRKHIWIDGFQTRMMLRIGLYFLLFQVTAWLLFVTERNLGEGARAALGPSGTAITLVIVTILVAFLGFLFLWDAMKTTHRLVGPLVRFRRAVQTIIDGEEVETLRLREGDYLQEFKDEFNEMLEVLEQRGAVTLKRNLVPQEAGLCRPGQGTGLPASGVSSEQTS